VTLSALAVFGAKPPVPARAATAAARGRPAPRPVRGPNDDAQVPGPGVEAEVRAIEAPQRVTVVIPAYRAAGTIARALHSVFAQTVPIHEILVIDDGSPDDLAAAVAPFGPRVTLIRKPNGGVSSARNVGIACATGDLIAFLDADDYWEPDKLARQLDVFAAHPDVGMVGSALFLREADTDARRLDPAIDRALFDRRLELDGPDAFHAAGMFWTGTVVLRRDVLADARFDETLTTAEDRELWLRMLLRAPAWLSSAPTATCVLEPASLSRGSVDRDCTNMLALVDRYHELLGDVAHASWRADVHRRWSTRLLAEGRSRDALVPALIRLRHTPSAASLWTVVRSAAQAVIEPAHDAHDPTSFTVETIDHAAALAALEPEWTALHERSGARTFATSWEWMSTWWDVFGDGRDLRVLTVRDGARLVGIMPLVRRTVRTNGVPIRQLEWLGTGEPEADEVLSEYLDVVSEPGLERRVLTAVWRQLAADSTWDELKLVSIEHDSRTRAHLRDAAGGPAVSIRDTQRNEAVLVRLAGDTKAFASGQSKKLREDLRRHRRLLEREGELRLIRATTLDELRVMFPTFKQLHQALWTSRGKPGCFASAAFTRFHQRLSERLWPRGVVHLHVLMAGEMAVAARYGFQLGERMFEYQSGADPHIDDKISIGMIAANLCMEEAITRGATWYDLGEGPRPYKLRWQHQLRATHDLRITRRNARTALADLLDASEQRLREVRKVVRDARIARRADRSLKG
jgi:glycosyltransferase involved in cell wall biosynthesis/CelD/BcsL family acetyltransferase involved in cellulose biosynthesis